MFHVEQSTRPNCKRLELGRPVRWENRINVQLWSCVPSAPTPPRPYPAPSPPTLPTHTPAQTPPGARWCFFTGMGVHLGAPGNRLWGHVPVGVFSALWRAPLEAVLGVRLKTVGVGYKGSNATEV